MLLGDNNILNEEEINLRKEAREMNEKVEQLKK